jgi:hypothetical protein
MGDDTSKRRFMFIPAKGDEPDEEQGPYTGTYPYWGAVKAARRYCEPGPDEETAKAEHSREIRIRETGTDKIHVYEAWAWRDTPDKENPPDWLPETVVEAKVAKKGAVTAP